MQALKAKGHAPAAPARSEATSAATGAATEGRSRRGGGFGDARSLLWRAFWAAHQRFFRHMCMAAKVGARRDLGDGAVSAVYLDLTNVEMDRWIGWGGRTALVHCFLLAAKGTQLPVHIAGRQAELRHRHHRRESVYWPASCSSSPPMNARRPQSAHPCTLEAAQGLPLALAVFAHQMMAWKDQLQ
jgi:hypothetical protein